MMHRIKTATRHTVVMKKSLEFMIAKIISPPIEGIARI
jgi:hypothetical protein